MAWVTWGPDTFNTDWVVNVHRYKTGALHGPWGLGVEVWFSNGRSVARHVGTYEDGDGRGRELLEEKVERLVEQAEGFGGSGLDAERF